MTRSGIALVIATVMILPASPTAAADKPFVSWGRAGVDFETYRNDSIECAGSAYFADVSETEQAQAFVRGTTRMESIDGLPLDPIEMAARYAEIERSVRPERRMEQLERGLQQILEDCLIERGYAQFSLTDEQREQLSDLKKGSPERHQFLHALASNPEVLKAQALPEQAG